MDRAEAEDLEVIQTDFLQFLDAIERRGHWSFRWQTDREKQDELVAELVALCWARWLRHKRRGIPIERFLSQMAGQPYR